MGQALNKAHTCEETASEAPLIVGLNDNETRCFRKYTDIIKNNGLEALTIKERYHMGDLLRKTAAVQKLFLDPIQ